ncbi:hypothetical protein ACFL42_01490 [Candidatus Omnitrophota bacterium]
MRLNKDMMDRRSGKKQTILFLSFLLLISYLAFNTGIISDDYDTMARAPEKDLFKSLALDGKSIFIDVPVLHYTHFIWYRYFELDDQAFVNAIKILYLLLSFFLISRFFTVFLDETNAMLASFLFIFFPSHDSTVYCFNLQYLTLSFAFYLYAFYLAHKNKLIPAAIFALIASFMSYGSTPIAIGLFVLFLLRKELKKGLAILAPNIIYAAYYIYISKVFKDGGGKISSGIAAGTLVKNFIMQIVTFIDAALGPSMWMKIYHSFFQLSALSLVIGILSIIVIARYVRNYISNVPRSFAKRNDEAISNEGASRPDKNLLLSLTALTFISFAMFAVNGRYPQIAFNLGNRVTIFGSLLLAYLLVAVPKNRAVRTVIFAVMIFCALGISDHWKAWNINQREVIRNIRDNPGLKNYKDDSMIYVSGNQYSKFGPVSHIEFLSERYVSAPVFQLALGKDIVAVPINKNHVFKDGYFIDTKDGFKEKIGSSIGIYDSEGDRFFRMDSKEMNSYIGSLPPEKRHWTQMVNVPFVRNILIRLKPESKKYF